MIGGKSATISIDQPNYQKVLKLCQRGRWKDAGKWLDVKTVLNEAKGKARAITGEDSPELAERVVADELAGNESYHEAFLARCAANPNQKSVIQLFRFLQYIRAQFLPSGNFLIYKGVTADYLDCHTKTINNRPGQVVSMPRSKVAFNPNEGCSAGLHVGSLDFVRGYVRIMLIEIDPADVVSVPHENSYQKMRVCRYKVLREITDRVKGMITCK